MPTTTGVSQSLNRLTYASSLSNLRRLKSPIDTTSKVTKPRLLHSTQWGMMCPAETPEGQSCGIVKNLALMCYISVGNPVGAARARDGQVEKIYRLLENNGVEELETIASSLIPKTTKVFVNGVWVGIHRDPKVILDHREDFDTDVSMVYDIQERELRITADAGRCCRPLYVVDPVTQRVKIRKYHLQNLQPETMFSDLVLNRLIEYVSAEEEEYCMIGMDLKTMRACVENRSCTTYTHCEIHPSMILGVCASIIPFPDHNQSPRNTYQSAMGKQAMGVYVSNYRQRMDTTAHVLSYPQQPLVTTKAMTYLRFKELPAGCNCVVAICCYSGYNQEDSLILNQSAIERGLFRSIFYRTYQDTEVRRDTTTSSLSLSNPSMGNERFCRPLSEQCSMTKDEGLYRNLDEDGLVKPVGFFLYRFLTIPGLARNGRQHFDRQGDAHRGAERARTLQSEGQQHGAAPRGERHRGRGDADHQRARLPLREGEGALGTHPADRRQTELATRTEGNDRNDVPAGRHALHGERHRSGHHHEPARHSLAYDHRTAHRVSARQGRGAAGARGRRHGVQRRDGGGHLQQAAQRGLPEARLRGPLQRTHRTTHGGARLHGPHLLPAPEAPRGRQDPRASPRNEQSVGISLRQTPISSFTSRGSRWKAALATEVCEWERWSATC